MTDGYLAFCHILGMLHGNIMKCLIPRERRETILRSELVRKVQSADAPTLRVPFPRGLSIISFACLLIYLSLQILSSDNFPSILGPVFLILLCSIVFHLIDIRVQLMKMLVHLPLLIVKLWHVLHPGLPILGSQG